MCREIQPIGRSKRGVPRSGKSAQRCACRALAPKAFGVICGGGVLSANGAGEKMRIDLANAVDIRRDFGALKSCARKCAAPLICGQKARVRANFGVRLDVSKTLQNLKH